MVVNTCAEMQTKNAFNTKVKLVSHTIYLNAVRIN